MSFKLPALLRPARIYLVCLLAGALGAAAGAQPVMLDDARNPEKWKVVAADGVTAALARDEAAGALRLDFHFVTGGGYCLVRREIELDLPANYAFSMRLKADSPRNNLEFKLVDPSNENVWWINQRAFEFPRDWQTLTWRARRFQFAWGPSGGTEPLKKVRAIEIAVAAAEGGKGSVWLDKLQFEALPPPEKVTRPAMVRCSSAADRPRAWPEALGPDGGFMWSSAPDDRAPTIDADFQQVREFGGVLIEWISREPVSYAIETSFDNTAWTEVARVQTSDGGTDFIPIRDGQARHLRIRIDRGPAAVKRLKILPLEVGDATNALFSAIARDAPRGWYPRYFLGEQQPWTVVGVAGDDKEALLDVAGALEVDKGAFRVEPFLHVGGQFITWADAEITQSLAEAYLPIPGVVWKTKSGVELRITALADGEVAKSSASVRYTVRNTGSDARRGNLYLAIRPFQVLPPWHELNLTGGATNISTITRNDRVVRIDADYAIGSWTPIAGFGAVQSAQDDVISYISRDELPSASAANAPDRLASAAIRYEFELAAGAEQSFCITSAFRGRGCGPDEGAAALTADTASAAFEKRQRAVADSWRAKLNRVKLELPPQANQLANTFRSQQAYIRINADGPSIQPGSRTYERSWMRDGALTSTALLYTGEAEAVRAFIDWYAPYQFESGKIPCVVDRRGPDPVPENDSHGQFLYLLWTYYEFTSDRDMLQKHFARVERAANYLEELHAQRRTAEFAEGPPEKRVLFGLVPESISHEGYSAKPMHSYWDDFFAVRGLDDAASMAAAIGNTELHRRWRKSAADARRALYDSMRLAMQLRGVDYIPGCAELGDFDATSTAIGLYPCGETANIPQPALNNTFERYYRFFCDRRDGRMQWKDYTPYEVRLIGSFVRLGQPERAHELAKFFFADQRPSGWNQWAEVVWRDPLAPRFIGDMPHTWVGSDYISAVRSMFVYERPAAPLAELGSGGQDSAARTTEQLVLGAGIPLDWVRAPGGVAIADFPTTCLPISYKLTLAGDVLTIDVAGANQPPGGISFRPPFPAKFGAVRGALPDGASLSADELLLSISPARVEVELRVP